ncbi:MAG: serine/threonine-protein kinase [Pseudomonadota bacterium]
MIKKNPALWLAVVLTLVFVVLAVFKVGFLESLELTSYDLRMRLRAAGPETKTDIAVVDIDDDSIAKLGRWPWPRAMIARMIDKLRSQGAGVIGLMVIFSEPEIGEGLRLVEDLKTEFANLHPDSGDPATLEFIQKLDQARERLDNDRRLTQAMADSGQVVLPVFFKLGPYDQPDENLPRFLIANGLVHVQGASAQYLTPASEMTAPIPEFSRTASGLGHININIIPDVDGALRRETLMVDYQGLAFPSFTLKIVQLAKKLANDQIHVFTPDSGREGLKLGAREIPTNPSLDFLVTFTDPRAFPRFSFFDVLNDKVQAAAVKGKIVLIGVSATGVDAPQVTPVDKKMPTTMFAANVVQNLLHGGFITRSGMMDLIELGLLMVVGLFLALLLPKLKARSGAIASSAFFVLLLGAGVYLFVGPGVWLKVTYPLLLIVIGYVAVTTTRYFVTEVVKDKAEGESAEVNRMLGLSFQNQGQLDLAFDKFRRVPVDDGVKDILYNLALDYERKRMFNKAVSVYEYIRRHDEDYRDIKNKIKKLNVASETMIFGLGTGAKSAEDGTLVIDENTRPTLGRYEVIKELGKGAMGVVYLGRDPQIGRETAIKTIRFDDEYDEGDADKIKEQFFSEAKTAGMLTHPHIVTIYDAGEDHDLSYIAMELLDGHDLKEHSRPDKLLPVRDVLKNVADMADALGYAHSKGVVHRDIKPANIMLLKNGICKLTDFGIARAMSTSKTKTGVVKGTPFYMSPEQITGKKVDGRSDIFSLGVVLYELLTGVQPFRSEDLTALIYKITQEDPVPVSEINPRAPKAAGQIIEKALVKDREKRYQKAEQMAEHLRLVVRKMDELAARKQTGG